MNAACCKGGAHTQNSGPIRQHHTFGERGKAADHDFFMSNSIHDAPGQAGMSKSPPGTSPDEDTGKGEIDCQPDYSPHSHPIDEPNDNNPVPWVVLPGFYNEG